MTEMEMQVGGEIMAWAMMNDDVPLMKEDASIVTTPELTQMFWDKYFSECEMSKPETGLELIE